MAKYILIYRGPATRPEDFTPEQAAEQMALWQAWAGRTGSALLDFGSPFGAGTSVNDDGTTGTPPQQTGYTIVEAADLDGAKSLIVGHPFLSEGKGRFAVDVYELLPM